MAYNKNQSQSPVPLNSNENRKSVDLLPKYFRTNANQKILSSTIDQMLQPGVATKVEGYYGRKTAKSFRANDTYINDVSEQRQNRQLEPAAVVTDDLGNVQFYKDYPDYINQISNFNGNVSNQSLLNSQEYYSWNPNIDWDKFVNFREYYWLPYGAQTVNVAGENNTVQSTYVVTAEEQDDNTVYLFSPPGFTPNPDLRLFRGQKYIFEINTPGHPFSFNTNLNFADVQYEIEIDNTGTYRLLTAESAGESISSVYIESMKAFDLDGNEIPPVNVEEGTIELTVAYEAPDRLYYASKTSINTSGLVKVFDIEENTSIDINDIIGKKTYRSANGVEFTNGLKVEFVGEVSPTQYATGAWYVEGVGEKIKLINEDNLTIPAAYVDDIQIEFDSEGFDRMPFENANSFAGVKDYIVINRSSVDRNPWSRYNRWFHRDVIEKSAEYNGQPAVIDQTFRATRPIIEFEAGLKLYQYGTQAKNDIDLIDTITKDVFSTIEGSLGYNIDGVDISEGMRILFAADTDILVKNKIYKVNFITVQDKGRIISLIEEADTTPLENETLLITNGTLQKGTSWYYDGTDWKQGQDKTATNQQPLFDLFDDTGNSISDKELYTSSDFTGNSIFSYVQNTQEATDSELGFGLSYKNIENLGDILFDFSLITESYTYQNNTVLSTIKSNALYLKKFRDRTNFTNQNGWSKGRKLSQQAVIRQYIAGDQVNNFAVDVFDNSGLLLDLDVKVILNNNIQKKDLHYTIDIINDVAFIRFENDLSVDDVLQLNCYSSATANSNGYYELAHNLERNPLNDDMASFTLGEVIDHVGTIVQNTNQYNGNVYPGSSNLRDLGDVDRFGTRFVKHSGPINLPLFHITNKEANVVKAIRYSRLEYAKFKRLFLQTANNLGYDGPVKQTVDKIFSTINAEKNDSMPFYFTDMVPVSGYLRTEHNVSSSDTNYYALNEIFSITSLTEKAVLVYLNGLQLTHGKDYTFNDEGFVNITATKAPGDIIEIYEYESTDGCYVPATPTKLGLYPKYQPKIFTDNTYIEPVTMIQGHDGSIVKAYDDFRDDLILELELRIFNNLKQAYNTNLLDIHDFIGGEYRDTKFTKKAIDKSYTADFIQWTTLAGNPDYTSNEYYIEGNSFTYNYKTMISPQGNQLPGWWRQVYIQAYDTDRPHTHPWEMLGFTIEPKWWKDEYGPSPYTRSNTLLWEDLQNGIIRDPSSAIKSNKKYSRPGLVNHIPVDDTGVLLSPLESNFAQNYVAGPTKELFGYGDGNPAETAWRKSAEYPFAVLLSWVLNQPAKVLGIGFDISRIKRDLVGNLVSTKTNNCIRLKDIVFPNTVKDNTRQTTSGLVNFVYNYLASNTTSNYKSYQNLISNINNRISLKVGGFTEQEKFKLILDSRTPLNKGNVFVPQENYKVFLNSSSPVTTISYSGVIVEKQSNGFIIRGYDREKATFEYKQPFVRANDPSINIGGISETFVEWSERKQYVKSQNVRFSGSFYRCKESHVSGTTIDVEKFQQIATLPLIGGSSAILRREFTTRELSIPYGTLLKTRQEVIDFLLGYEASLVEKGFEFNYYNDELSQVSNWSLSVKEFLFWTTQNWAAGSVLSLSPAASEITFSKDYCVVDDIFDKFYDYSLFKSDGTRLDKSFTSIVRDNQNTFGILPKNTQDGIYHIKLPLVQKEHVVLLDNETVFGDVIYDQPAGYRQERIKVVGYKSDGWTGGLNIPGFVYDEAIVDEWTSYKDYSIGSLVKYKEFYYVSTTDLTGVEKFNENDWERLDERPQPKMYPNFDYRINQFADFYDLDSDNFDVEQQKHAQHLIGYQKRQYLQNIINDDVSQYKFYQGMIQDKGTINSLDKLFDALSSADKDSIDFYEEWAIRAGQYGATDNFNEVEFIIDEDKIKIDPTTVQLVKSIPANDTDDIYKIIPNDVYYRPKDYNHKPFPTTNAPHIGVKTSGYVNDKDVVYKVKIKADLLQSLPSSIGISDYVWITGTTEDWDVLQHITTDYHVTSIEGFTELVDAIDRSASPAVKITFDRTTNFIPGDIVGLQQVGNGNWGFYQIEEINNTVAIASVQDRTLVNDSENLNGYVSILRSVRASSLDEANLILEKFKLHDQVIWLDGTSNNDWKVIKRQETFTDYNVIDNPYLVATETNFSNSMATSLGNTNLLVGDETVEDGVVHFYSRASSSNNLRNMGELTPETSAVFGIGVTNANPGVVTATDHNLQSGELVRFKEVSGMTALNNLEFYANVINENTISMYSDVGLTQSIDTTSYGTFISGLILKSNGYSLKSNFGHDVAISPDGKLAVVGAPNATNISDNIKGDFREAGPVGVADAEYKTGDIVKYNENYWKAVRNIPAENNAIEFSTFDSYAFFEETIQPLPETLVINFPLKDDGITVDQLGSFEQKEIVNVQSNNVSAIVEDIQIILNGSGNKVGERLTLSSPTGDIQQGDQIVGKESGASGIINTLEEAAPVNINSRQLTLILQGNPYLPNSVTDHILVRAPLDQYRATKPQDKIVLGWNRYTGFNRASDQYTSTELFTNSISLNNTGQPDSNNKTYVAPRSSFINNEHEIIHKVDHVLYIVNPLIVPEVNDTVDCSTGSAKVVKVISKVDRLVVYITETNGFFPTDSTVSLESVVIGDYTQPNNTTNNGLGGFWYIAAEADGYYNGNEFSDLSKFGIPAYGLVYKDVLIYDETNDSYSSTNRFYYNSLDNVGATPNKEPGHLQILSHRGDAYDAVSGVRDIKDSRWIIRAPAAASFSEDDEFRVWINTEEGINDLSKLDGQTGDQVVLKVNNNEHNDLPHVVNDIWDGYIDILLTAKQTADIDVPSDIDTDISDYFEPSVGDYIEDGVTGARAQVVHYIKRNIADVRVYVKDITITNTGFQNRNDIRVDFTPYSLGRRPMGQIQKVSIAGTGHDSSLGKFLVVTASSAPKFYDSLENPAGYTPENYFNSNPSLFTFDPHPDSYGSTDATKDLNVFGYINKEYWIYSEKTDETGATLSASYPASTNRDWTLTNNIPVIGTGTSGFYNNSGVFMVYTKAGTEWQRRGTYTVPVTTNNAEYNPASPQTTVEQLGKQVEISQEKDLYRIFVSSKDKVFVIKHGVDNNDIEYNFALDIDNRYRGTYSTLVPYAKDEIVLFEGNLYQSKTFSFAVPTTNTNNWILLDQNIQNNFFVPNTNVGNIYSDTLFDSVDTVLDFSKDMAVSEDGQVLVISIQTNTTSDADNKVVIYRLNSEGRYIWSQTLVAPTSNTQWASSIDVTPNGNTLVVGDPGNDDNGYDTGKVYVYTRIGTSFVLTDTLIGNETELARKFGTKVSATEDIIAISSFNGDITANTTYDDDTTILDNRFTKFVNTQIDSGSVTLYEKFDNGYIFAEELEYSNIKSSRFAETLLINRNHIYVGCAGQPASEDVINDGQVINYISPKGTKSWNVIRSANPVVDTTKIRKVFLYNRKTGQLVKNLDYVDIHQGKIPGPAEQELTFKSSIDLAKYNVTSDINIFNDTDNWESNYVGKLWWDISTARFHNHYQGEPLEQAQTWHSMISTYSIDVYEWVESSLLPSEWDAQADTPEGYAKGISGQTKYSDAAYSQKLTYDNVSKSFGTKYFYWVKNKLTIPSDQSRTISAGQVSSLIGNPKAQGYQFAALLSNDRFVLYNCQSLFKDDDIVLHVDYYTLDNQEQNIHTQYQLISQGLETSEPSAEISQKWIDSLVGYDVQGRHVPDNDLTVREKYGINYQPRQSWFINRHEALKQVVERANSVLKENIIVDDFDFTRLTSKDTPPSTYKREYDVVIDTIDDLQFVGTAKARPAIVDLIVNEGVVTRARILDRGRSYKDINGTLKGPSYNIVGAGSDLEIATTINNIDGSLASIEILNGGTNFEDTTQLLFRKLRVLVNNDETANGRWSIYEWNHIDLIWERVQVQSYNTGNYWNYTNWFAAGYNQFTTINHLVSQSYELENVDDRIGDITKISNIGSGGWLLLQKTADTGSRNYTDDYTTIGRENGTIEIDPAVYTVSTNASGFDSFTFDGNFYDNEPNVEIRNILDALRYDILVDNLRSEYNELFFSSIRYVLSEQPNVDWVFKTSFVKAKHNVGELREDITFNNDNLPSYNEYIEEVKPYKTNIREYLSSYERTDNTNTLTSDFDVPPIYQDGKIVPSNLKVRGNQFIGSEGRFNEYPDKNWYDNAGYKITSVEIYDGGNSYTYPPKVIFEGGGGTGAVAHSYIARGKVNKIEITNPGSGYTSAPTVILEGSVQDGGETAIATAILGETLTKTMHVAMKFDRTSKTFVYNVLPEIETFTGTAAKLVFDLKYPMDLRTNKLEIIIDGEKQLRSQYTYENVKDTTKSYTRSLGRINFVTPPALNSVITVSYSKDVSMLNAADRVTNFYDPTTGMLGAELSQVMTGIDFGGVEVRSFDFDTESGWDTDGWFTTPWDTYDNTYEDHVFYADGTTIIIELDSALEDGVTYNIYRNGVRIDDSNYPANPTNPNAIMTSIVGDGQQTLINLAELGIDLNTDDILIVRKITSEGTVNPDTDSYDTQLSGGQLNYGNAGGTASEDIIVDGDLFVTPNNAAGTEELVAGQVLDTVDIKVFERSGTGTGQIYSQNFITDGTTVYDLVIQPNSPDAVIVKINSNIVHDYTIDLKQNTLTFTSAPTVDQLLTILTIGKNGQNILDIDSHVADGSTTIFETSVAWQDDLQIVTTIDGEAHSPEAVNARKSANNRVEFEFTVSTEAGSTLEYEIYSNKDEINYSKVAKSVLVATGGTKTYTLPVTPLYSKPEGFYTIVEVDNKVLMPGYSRQFTIDSPLTREYEFEKFQVAVSTLQPSLLKVYLNDTLLNQGTQYLVNIGNSSIILDPGILKLGDKLELFTMDLADYIIEGNVLTFTDNFAGPQQDDIINVYTFSNHGVNEIERYSYTALARSSLTVGTDEFTRFHSILGGKIRLNDPAIASQYVWTIINGELLQPNVDYSLSDDKQHVILNTQLTENDTVDVIHFSAPLSTPKIAWRQFQDILNRNMYKRLDNALNITLQTDLLNDDLRINVVDTSQLPDPDRRNNIPGVVFINGERIEYLVKDNNLLRQLRRGTLGTGIKDIHYAGTKIEPAGREKNIPYADKTHVQNFIATQGQTNFELDFVPNSVNEFEVFAAGKRLRKTALEKFVIGSELDSPEGDITLAPEFTLSGSTLVLLTPIEEDKRVTIIRKTGQIWGPTGTPIKDLQNDIGNFLRGSISELPE